MFKAQQQFFTFNIATPTYPGVMHYPACPPDVLSVFPTCLFPISSQSVSVSDRRLIPSTSVFVSPHLPLPSPDPPPPGLEFPPVVSAAPSPSPVGPSYFGAYRSSCCLSRYRCTALAYTCSQHPSAHHLVQVSQDLRIAVIC